MQDVNTLLEQFKAQLRTELKNEMDSQLQNLKEDNDSLREELDTLRSKESVEEEYWLEASQSRNHGNCELPESFREVFNEDSLRNRKDTRCIYKVLSDYPEPRGGWLKPQNMDAYTVSEEYKGNEDKYLSDAQRFILQGIKPAIAIEFMCNDMSKTNTEKLEAIRKINLESTKLHLHFAQEVRIFRRLQAAKRFDLVPKSECHTTTGSSDDSLLFGPELRKTILEEKTLETSRKNAAAKGRDPTRGNIKRRAIPYRRGIQSETSWRKPFPQSQRPVQQSQSTTSHQ